MRVNFNKALELVLVHEGGFVNHPADPGGATNKGITLATFRAHVKKNGTVADLKALTTEQAGKVYRAEYWDKVKGDDLPSGLDYAVFDFAVNSGPARAAKYLQAILGLPQDGIIGPQTIAACNRANVTQLITKLCDNRLAFLQRLPTWPTFGKGWGRRVADVKTVSLSMAAKSPVPSIPPSVVLPEHKSFWAGVAVAVLNFFSRFKRR